MPLPKEKTSPKVNLSDYTIMLYGATKIGKSTFCSNADKALFLATEPGLNALSVYQVQIKTWEDLAVTLKEVEAGDHDFKTIVIDTIDNAYKMCSDYICRKHKIDHESDLAFGKGWNFVNMEFTRVMTKIAFMPYGLWLISHSMEREVDSRTGKYTKTGCTLPDKINKVMMGMVDIILYVDQDYVESDGKRVEKRVLRTKPTKFYEAGDRTGRLPETIDFNYEAFLKSFNGAPAAQVVAPLVEKKR